MVIPSREEPEKQSLLRRPGAKSTNDNTGKLVSGRNWVCDVCRSSNNPNTSICSVCHQSRTITPINVSPVFADPTDSDKMEVTVDIASTKPVEKHHKSRHSGRRESRHRHRNESPISQPKQVGFLWELHRRLWLLRQ